MVVTTGIFDVMTSREVRFFQEIARKGPVTVGLFDDELARQLSGVPPKFPLAERTYYLQSLRYVDRVIPVSDPGDVAYEGGFPGVGGDVAHEGGDPGGVKGSSKRAGNDLADALHQQPPALWAHYEKEPGTERMARHAADVAASFEVISPSQLDGFPDHSPAPSTPGRNRVVVTGCYDWFHTGHIRFFEEASAYGELCVIAGNDKNVSSLKGPDHPMFGEQERRYLTGAVRFVHRSLVSSGMGWLDAVQEIDLIDPRVYVVNEDGDRPEKRAFCQQRGIEYVVLERKPRPGLTPRSSTQLRGY